MPDRTQFERVAFSPAEFAELFSKSQTWGYRQIYAGKVKAITQHGRTLIAATEVQRILETAGIYDGPKNKAAKTKPELQRLPAAKLRDAWTSFLAGRRAGVATAGRGDVSTPVKPSGARNAALARLTRAK